MKERWDERCRDILLAARQESVDMENHFLGTEHIALAMLADPDSMIAQLLESLELDPAEIRLRVREQSTKGPLEHGPNIPITPRMRRIVAAAEQLSIQDGAELIQEGHFLTALLDGGPGVVVRVLHEFGVSVPDLVVDLRECMFGEQAGGNRELREIATVAGPARRPPLLPTPARGEAPDKPAEEPAEAGTLPGRYSLRDADADRDGGDDVEEDDDELAPTMPRRPGLPVPRSPLAAPAPPAPPAAPNAPHGRKPGLTGTRPSRAAVDGTPAPPDLSGSRAYMPGSPLLLDLGVVKAKQAPGKDDSGNVLDKLGRDLTELAERGHLGPIVGRDHEIEELALALCRASRNNPLLLGEPGVGKTAIVEGLAIRIVQGQVPRSLKRARLIELPVAAVSADTRFRGELEERLLAIVEEAQRENVVLVVDDVHALLGATRTQGSADAGTILKPYLARGDIRLIGTTTPRAYAMHIERDTALARCFHPIRVEEPEDDVVAEILLGICERFESFHRVSVLREALEAVIVLGRDCVKDRRMPDVAVDLLDQACVRAAASVEDRLGMDDASRRDESGKLRSQDVEREHGVVTAELVAQVVSRWTGIPVEKLTTEESQRMVDMEEVLGHQVIGQEDAVSRVCERIRMYKAGFHDERRPLGVFLFLGPTGVGKTELARALAGFLFKSDEHLHRFDMSEFAQAHEVAKLIGSPPGYVGHEEEGQLTGVVRRDPHCLILLDEIEKAHARVFDLFLQVFDEGRLTDGKGVTTDFTHTLIILTSNMGADLWKDRPRMGFRREEERHGGREGGEEDPDERRQRRDEDDRRRRIRDTLKETFRSEFINRLDDVVLFRALSPEHIREIAWQMVERWQKKSRDRGHEFEVTDETLDFLCQEGYDEELGARPLKRVIEEHLIGPLSRQILKGRIRPGMRIVADYDKDRIVFFQEEYDSGA